jgi:hypothetical protein
MKPRKPKAKKARKAKNKTTRIVSAKGSASGRGTASAVGASIAAATGTASGHGTAKAVGASIAAAVGGRPKRARRKRGRPLSWPRDKAQKMLDADMLKDDVARQLSVETGVLEPTIRRGLQKMHRNG